MSATGPAIMDPAHAVAVASIEGDLSSHIAQLQKTVRSQQAMIDEQEARLHNMEILVARMMQRLGIPVSAGAMACPVAASSPTGPAAARASTSVSTVAAEGMVAEADCEAEGPWVTVDNPKGELINCNLCEGARTYICANATVDDAHRAGCMKMQG